MIMGKEQQLSCYEPLPHEPAKSFNEFTGIRDRKPHKRTYRLVAEDNLKAKGIIKTHNNYNNELKKELNRLLKLSEKWRWQERFKLYDIDKQIELIKKRDDTFYGMNKALLDIVEGLIKYANNLLAELINGNATKKNGDEFSLGTKIKMLNEITSVIKTANELLCNLCGRPSDYKKVELDGDIGVTHKETEAEKLERAKEYFKEIETQMKEEQENNMD